jgi:hypothetical protein
MGCGCNKNKDNNPNQAQSNQNNQAPAFRKQQITEQSMVKKKMSMLQSFATAIASRGLADNKVQKPIKQLRVLSCFGNQAQGGVLPPCEYLKESSTPGKFYCGGCGCGDREGTWLIAEGDTYSKLDYPKLTCPLAMPGFSNYQQSKEEEGNDPVTRRWYIDNNMKYEDFQNIPVSTHEMPTTPTPQEQNQQSTQ